MPLQRNSANTEKGTKSIEKLAHFRCVSCSKWWSVGDAPQRDEWFCPWCGLKQSFTDKTPKNIDGN